MIGKAKSNKSLAATIAYNLKEKAELVYSNRLEGESLAEYQLQMQDLQRCYQGYGKQLTIHAILSPSIEDGRKLTNELWSEMADKYLEKMNMKELQAIGFLHTDRGHNHLHLVINKVRADNFKPVSDSYIGKKTQKIADTIACEMKLARAMQIRQDRINDAARIMEAQKIGIHLPEEKPVGIKQQFKFRLEQILKSSFHSTDDYFKALENAGFKLHQYRDKQTGEIRGYGIERDGIKMDASAISKKFTLYQLKMTWDAHQRRRILKPNPEISQISKPTIIKDFSKIAALKKFALSMGIPEAILASNTEMVEQGNRYYIAMRNDSGGYSMNNVFEKRQSGEIDITTKITHPSLPVIVTDDVLSYLLHKAQHPTQQSNFIILNSLANKEKAIQKLAQLKVSKVSLELKNDAAGNLISHQLIRELKHLLHDCKNILTSGTRPQQNGPDPVTDFDDESTKKLKKKTRIQQ